MTDDPVPQFLFRKRSDDLDAINRTGMLLGLGIVLLGVGMSLQFFMLIMIGTILVPLSLIGILVRGLAIKIGGQNIECAACSWKGRTKEATQRCPSCDRQGLVEGRLGIRR